MKCVFILGAGASHQAGGPLMSNFIEMAEKLYNDPQSNLGESKRAFENIINVLNVSQTLRIKSKINLNNIEEFFGAIEMGLLLGRFPGVELADLSKLREDLITVVYKTLELSIKFPLHRNTFNSPIPYDIFCALIRIEINRALEDKREYSFTFITFNYDLSLDFGCRRASIPIDYGLKPDWNEKAVRLLKLHGSLNWGICPACDEVITRSFKEPFPKHRDPKDSYTAISLHNHLNETTHCDVVIPNPPITVRYRSSTPPVSSGSITHNLLIREFPSVPTANRYRKKSSAGGNE